MFDSFTNQWKLERDSAQWRREMRERQRSFGDDQCTASRSANLTGYDPDKNIGNRSTYFVGSDWYKPQPVEIELNEESEVCAAYYAAQSATSVQVQPVPVTAPAPDPDAIPVDWPRRVVTPVPLSKGG